MAAALGIHEESSDDWILDWELLSRKVQASERTEHRVLGTATPPPTPLEHWLDDYPEEAPFAARMLRQELINGRIRRSPEGLSHHDEGTPILLLQLDTDVDGPGWRWGKKGRLYFHIDAEDLKRRAFEACTVWDDIGGWP